jgi:hypothetical protein
MVLSTKKKKKSLLVFFLSFETMINSKQYGKDYYGFCKKVSCFTKVLSRRTPSQRQLRGAPGFIMLILGLIYLESAGELRL